MTALLPQPNHQWRFSAALATALLIHCAAIGFGKMRSIPTRPPGTPDFTQIDFLEPLIPENPRTEDIEAPLTPPAIDPTFIESAPTPPPRRQFTNSNPIIPPKNNAGPRATNLSSAKVLAVNAPRPDYPYEARRQKITGSGIAVMTIDPGTGSVMNVAMVKSTGNSFLDNAALAGFRRWRFRAGTASSVTCPVTFTLTGASY